jgi:diguanylate cyclase (GGDEF)-like protein
MKCFIINKAAGLSGAALLSFFASLILCSFLVSVTIINRVNIEKLQMEQLILEKSLRINEVISRLLYKTNSLAMMLINGEGVVENFDRIAPSIVDDPAILNILIAPDGIVSNVYPMDNNNDAIMGWDFFSDNPGNREAIAAINSGALMLGGPFKSAQGIYVLVGRLPVYIDTQTEKQKFLGLVSVTLKFPQALDAAELGIFQAHKLAYELWRINPDTNERQVIASSYEFARSGSRYIEKYISIFNADWYLKVWPIRTWYSYPENIALIAAGLLISLLVMFVMQNNVSLKKMKLVLENMAKCDPLTGIYNRRYFMERSLIDIERVRRLNENSFIILFDLDKFKNVNDTHGHIIGDSVLLDVTSRIKAAIRPYDLFARYGGEEFIIYASGVDKNGILDMAERLRLSLYEKKFEYESVCVELTASFGVADIDDYDISKAVLNADKAMYKAKSEGRNRVVFWE